MDEYTPFMRFGDVIQHEENYPSGQVSLIINDTTHVKDLLVDEGKYLFFGSVTIIENDPASQLDFYLQAETTIDGFSWSGVDMGRGTLIGVGEIPKQDPQDPNYPIYVSIKATQQNGSTQARVVGRIIAMKIEGAREV